MIKRKTVLLIFLLLFGSLILCITKSDRSIKAVFGKKEISLESEHPLSDLGEQSKQLKIIEDSRLSILKLIANKLDNNDFYNLVKPHFSGQDKRIILSFFALRLDKLAGHVRTDVRDSTDCNRPLSDFLWKVNGKFFAKEASKDTYYLIRNIFDDYKKILISINEHITNKSMTKPFEVSQNSSACDIKRKANMLAAYLNNTM